MVDKCPEQIIACPERKHCAVQPCQYNSNAYYYYMKPAPLLKRPVSIWIKQGGITMESLRRDVSWNVRRSILVLGDCHMMELVVLKRFEYLLPDPLNLLRFSGYLPF